MMSKFPTMSSCCCGVGLQAGTKVIGFFSLFGNTLGGFLRIMEWVFVKPTKPKPHAWVERGTILLFDTHPPNTTKSTFDFGPIQDAACIGTAVLSFILVFCAALLLSGAFNSRRILLKPWLIFDMLLRCMHLVGFAYCIITAKANVGELFGFWSSVAIFYATCIGIGISIYFWWVVLSFYVELQEKERIIARQNANWTNSSELVIL